MWFDFHDGNPCPGISLHDGVYNGSSTSPFGQQASMDIDHSVGESIDDTGRYQVAKRNHYTQIVLGAFRGFDWPLL